MHKLSYMKTHEDNLVFHSTNRLGKGPEIISVQRRAVVPLPKGRQYRAGGSTAPSAGGSTGAAVVPGGKPLVLPLIAAAIDCEQGP